MFIRLLKAIAELVYVSVRLGYDYMFYPSSKTVERAEKILDPTSLCSSSEKVCRFNRCI